MSLVTCKRCKQTFSLTVPVGMRRGKSSKQFYAECECEGRNPLCENCAYTIANSAAIQLCPDCGVPFMVEVQKRG